jgi:hypothetical protein
MGQTAFFAFDVDADSNKYVNEKGVCPYFPRLACEIGVSPRFR